MKRKRLSEILEKLEALFNPTAIEDMAKFGITPKKTYGVSIPVLRKMAKEIGKDHKLALGHRHQGNTGISQYD